MVRGMAGLQRKQSLTHCAWLTQGQARVDLGRSGESPTALHGCGRVVGIVVSGLSRM